MKRFKLLSIGLITGFVGMLTIAPVSAFAQYPYFNYGYERYVPFYPYSAHGVSAVCNGALNAQNSNVSAAVAQLQSAENSAIQQRSDAVLSSYSLTDFMTQRQAVYDADVAYRQSLDTAIAQYNNATGTDTGAVTASCVGISGLQSEAASLLQNGVSYPIGYSPLDRYRPSLYGRYAYYGTDLY